MNEEIITLDIRKLFQILWNKKWTLVLITLLFSIIGAVYSFNLREEFISSGKILPEVQGKGGGLGQLSGLASLAGVDLGSAAAGMDAIRPDLYPDVVKSTPFYLQLFKAKVRNKENKILSFEEYYHQVIEEGESPEEKLTQKFPVKEEGVIVLNRLNEIRLKDLRERITSSIDKKSGIISIQTKMPDPVVAADVSRFAMEYLMEYVKDYRTSKLRKEVDFLGEQVAASRGKYYSTQEKKARYSDQFQSQTIRLQSADVQRERIESDYKISSTFYNELLKKYEEAKVKLHQETPVFQVLEPPVVPVKKAEPKRAIIVLGFTLLGGILSILIALLRNKNYKSIITRGN